MIIILDEVYLEKFGVWGLVVRFEFLFLDNSCFNDGFVIIWLIN